jgi:hypothetical protein
VRGRPGRARGRRLADRLGGPPQRGHERSVVPAKTRSRLSAARASKAVRAQAVRRLRRRERGCGVTLDAAGEPAAVRDARHDAAGERRDGARPQRAGQQHHRRHHRLVEAHARRRRQLRRRHVDPGRVDAGRVHAAVLRVGDPARRAHDRRGRRVHRGERRLVGRGRDLQPGHEHLGFRRAPTGLDEHRGRRERRPARRHLHASAPVRHVPDESQSHGRRRPTQREDPEVDGHPVDGQGRPQRRRGLDSGAERPAANARPLGAGCDPAVQPPHPNLVVRGKHGRERQSRRPVPCRRDRAAGRDAGRRHVRRRCRIEHARGAHGVHHGRADADRAVSVPARDRGHVVRGAGDPCDRRRGVRQHRRARVGPAGRERAVRRERVRVQHADSLLPLRRELEHAHPGHGRAQRPERHLIRHADAGAAERPDPVQRRHEPDGGLHGRRNAQSVLGAVHHVPELQGAGSWRHLRPVGHAAGGAGPGSHLR